MSQKMTSQDTHSPGFWQWVHTFEWKSVRPIQRPRRQGLCTLCFSVRWKWHRLPSSCSHCGHISPDHECPHSCLWFLMMDLACCVTAGSWVRLCLRLQMNYYALCWDGVGFIFRIVSIMTLFSKSSGNENENNDTTSSSMTHTSPPKRLNSSAAVMTGGRTHTGSGRQTTKRERTTRYAEKRRRAYEDGEGKTRWRMNRTSPGWDRHVFLNQSRVFLVLWRDASAQYKIVATALARAYPPRNPSPCHSLDGSTSWEAWVRGCN